MFANSVNLYKLTLTYINDNEYILQTHGEDYCDTQERSEVLWTSLQNERV